jgi:hypothetical protein
MSQPIKSELSVASTEEVKAIVDQDLEETEDVDMSGIAKYMKTTGGTRAKRFAEAKRLWEQENKTKSQS